MIDTAGEVTRAVLISVEGIISQLEHVLMKLELLVNLANNPPEVPSESLRQ